MAASGPISRYPEQTVDYYQKAKDAMADNNYRMLFKFCKEGLKFDDKNSYFWFGLGRYHFMNGNNKDAFKCFLAAAQLANERHLNGADWEILKYLGLCYIEGRGVKPNDVEAEKCFKGAIQCANVHLNTLISQNDLCERLIVQEEIRSLQIYANDASLAIAAPTFLSGYDSQDSSDEDNDEKEQNAVRSAPINSYRRR